MRLLLIDHQHLVADLESFGNRFVEDIHGQRVSARVAKSEWEVGRHQNGNILMKLGEGSAG